MLDHARIDRLNRLDEAVTIATLPAFAEVEPKTDGRDRQDHPVRRAGRGGRAAACVARRGRSAAARRALSAARRRADPDAAAGHQGERARQDRGGDRASGSARRAAGWSARRAARTRSPALAERIRASQARSRADRRRLGDHRPARRAAGGDRGGRRRGRAFRHAGRSRQPAAAGAPSASARCWACRAAPARPS